MKRMLRPTYLTISNILTASRIVSTPFIVAGLVHGWFRVVFVLFALAAITDMLDGYLARLWDERTVLGAYLDPLADKILFISCFITLSYIQFPSLPLPWWFVTLVLLREAVVVFGAIFVMMRKKQSIAIEPTQSGKFTAAGYMVLIGWLFICHFFSWMPLKTFTVALVCLSGLALVSLVQYIRRGVALL